MTTKELELLEQLIVSLVGNSQFELAYAVLAPFYHRYLEQHPELSGFMGMIDMGQFLTTENLPNPYKQPKHITHDTPWVMPGVEDRVWETVCPYCYDEEMDVIEQCKYCRGTGWVD